MAAFWKKDKEEKKDQSADNAGEAVAGDEKKETKPEKGKDKKAKKKKISGEMKKKAGLVNSVISKPIISEDAMNKQALGKYVFEVGADSNKNIIKEAVEAMYEVEVENVNLMNYKPKKRSFRRFQGQQKGYKKAVVTVKEGQEIKLFNE